MSIREIAQDHGVPAHKGGRVRYTSARHGPHLGTIIGADRKRLAVWFDGDTRGACAVRPTDPRLEYLPEASS